MGPISDFFYVSGIMEGRRAVVDWDERLIQLDYLYNTSDKLYTQFARSCGLSSCAYWMLYDLQRAGGAMPLRGLCDSWSYSKQTINSALKVLESRELIALDYCEGSRRNKMASLTEEGRAFNEANIVPAMEAEGRAFKKLDEDDRERLLALVGSYTAALEAEFNAVREQRSQEDGAREQGKGESA